MLSRNPWVNIWLDGRFTLGTVISLDEVKQWVQTSFIPFRILTFCLILPVDQGLGNPVYDLNNTWKMFTHKHTNTHVYIYIYICIYIYIYI